MVKKKDKAGRTNHGDKDKGDCKGDSGGRNFMKMNNWIKMD